VPSRYIGNLKYENVTSGQSVATISHI